ncbi:MAG: hypothetical protein KDD02_23885 [Phaeodactylibacter sp.]|nr:hypothetical protein [Phaeodactylibacter sp.]MCB9300278.1 hypothetical protein [Lewinellaceae bacterium]
MANKKFAGKKGVFGALLLLLLLVGLPIGSWYYLQTGLNYRIQTRAEMKDYARMPGFTLQNYNDSLVQSSQFQNGRLVGYFFSEPYAEQYGKILAQLHDQYDERDDVFFLTFNPDTSAAARTRMAAFVEEYQLKDPQQCFFLSGEEGAMQSLAQACQLPFAEKEMSLEDNSLLFFADSLMVRGFYDLRDPQELKRLIRHITFNIPLKQEREVVVKREKEK